MCRAVQNETNMRKEIEQKEQTNEHHTYTYANDLMSKRAYKYLWSIQS